jgi:large subunit ribosomal protein L30
MAAKKETKTTTTKKAAPKKKAAASKIRIQYYRSSIGFNVQQKLTVKGLGFGKLNSTRELVDTPALRGMIAKVPHLVRIVE